MRQPCCKSHFVVVFFALLLLYDAKVSRLFHYFSKRRDSGIYEEILGRVALAHCMSAHFFITAL